MLMLLFNFRYFIDISNINIMKWKEIKNKLFTSIKTHVETNKLKKNNKEIHVVVKVLLGKLHKCKEDKKPLSQTQALDFFTHKDSMMREINNENAYSDTVNKLASLLVDLSNEIVPADIEKEKSTHSPKNNFKVCGDLKKNMKV